MARHTHKDLSFEVPGAPEIFRHAGGAELDYVPCLNASAGGVAVLRQLLSRELAGWVDGAIDLTAHGN